MSGAHGKCPHCDGWGYTSEHDPYDPHINGCGWNCPIQVPCEKCRMTGFVFPIRLFLVEKMKKKEEKFIDEIYDGDLPF